MDGIRKVFIDGWDCEKVKKIIVAALLDLQPGTSCHDMADSIIDAIEYENMNGIEVQEASKAYER